MKQKAERDFLIKLLYFFMLCNGEMNYQKISDIWETNTILKEYEKPAENDLKSIILDVYKELDNAEGQ